ncbi:MAG: fibronectin type III-like domain-contianing protein, partial [Acidimicrobiales bacterium]
SFALPPRELTVFEWVDLAVGERVAVWFGLEPRAFAYWDPGVQGWRVEPGEFDILVGASSAEIRAKARVVVSSPGGTQ